MFAGLGSLSINIARCIIRMYYVFATRLVHLSCFAAVHRADPRGPQDGVRHIWNTVIG
jgi:hypothetical protein